MASPCELSISEAGKLIKDGTLSPVELLDDILRRIETYDPVYRVFVTLTAEHARSAARRLTEELQRGEYRGPLHGIPIGLKDIIKTKGIRTTGGSRILANYVPDEDAHVWARLQDAGAVLLGKLETHEFANGGPRRISDKPYDLFALNPWDRTKYTAGSSNGSAAAVAAGLCMAALGTDTGGSIRIPAARCGLFGLKPTLGRVSRSGIFPVSYSVDQCGPMTRCVADAALMLDAIAGPDVDDPSCLPSPLHSYAATLSGDIRGMRVGFIRHFSHEDVQARATVNGALDDALATLKSLGASVCDIRLPPLSDFTAANTIVLLAEAYAFHQSTLSRRFDEYSEYTGERTALGAFISAADYIHAQRFRQQLSEAYAEALHDVDVVICACTTDVAPDAEEAAGTFQKFLVVQNPVLTAPFNAVGAPAASILCGFDVTGMPIGMQIAAMPGRDDAVLRVAHAYEQASPWRYRRPELTTVPLT